MPRSRLTRPDGTEAPRFNCLWYKMESANVLIEHDESLARRLANLFRQRGYHLYLVGGSVRDLILGQPTHDLDFATDATPEVTRSILVAAEPTATYSIGEKFGTIGATF